MNKPFRTFGKRTLSILLTLCMTLMLFPFSVLAADNLLTNGDFETGDTTGWTVSISAGESLVEENAWSDNTSNYFQMSNWATTDAASVAVTQTVTLSAGTYTASIQAAGDHEGSTTSDLVFSAVSESGTLASADLELNGWTTWETYSIEFEVEEDNTIVTLGVTGGLAYYGYCYLDNATLYQTSSSSGEETSEGYAVSVTTDSTTVTAGSTVTLDITVTYDGEEITDLSAAGLSMTTWLDYWNDHTDGNTDASIGSPNDLTTTVTLPTAGTYYVVTELYDGTTWEILASATTTFTVTDGEEEDTAVSAEINVEKVDGLSDDFIMGVDISSIVSELNSGVKYYDFDGNELDTVAKFCAFLKECGVTTVRVRVWNDPYDEDGNGYGGGNNDVDTAVEIAEGCAAAGLDMLIDFHYSDFWADPGKQTVPKAWEGMTVAERADAIYTFTLETLETLAETGASITMVQVGNETNNGMTGVFSSDYSGEDLCTLYSAGSKAIREFDETVQVVIHVTNPNRGNMVTSARLLDTYNVDYDILATSYYTYWHGTLENLQSQMETVRETYGKDVMVAETSYPFTYDDTDGHENSVTTSYSSLLEYSVSVQGQADCMRDIIATVSEAGGLGVFYWEPAWITVGDTTGLTGEEYDLQVAANSILWETYGSGWASSYSGDYDSDAADWYGGSSWDNQAMFDASGNPLASINIWNLVYTGSVSAYTSVEEIESPTESIEVGGSYTLPDTVTVTYSSGSVAESVEWDADDVAAIDTSTAGTYTVTGTITFSKEVNSGDYAGETTATVTYTLTVKEVNLIGDDWSFENGSSNFSGLGSNGTNITTDDPYDGSYALHWYLTSGRTSTVTYLGEDSEGITLEPGTYTFECYTQGYSGDTVTLSVVDHDTGETLETGDTVTLTGWANWLTPTVTFTITETTTVALRMTIVFQDGGWGTIDCMYLYQVSSAEEEIHTHTWDDGAIKTYYEDISEYRSSDGYTSPDCVLVYTCTECGETQDGDAVSGYIFAGWYKDEGYTTSISSSTTSGEAYAKFVDAKVLTLKVQMSVNTSGDAVTLRLITSIDSTNYQEVIFDIAYVDETGVTQTLSSLSTSNAYTSVSKYTPSSFSDDSAYLAAYNVGVSQKWFDTALTITPKWVTADGTTVTGTGATLTLSDYLS